MNKLMLLVFAFSSMAYCSDNESSYDLQSPRLSFSSECLSIPASSTDYSDADKKITPQQTPRISLRSKHLNDMQQFAENIDQYKKTIPSDDGLCLKSKYDFDDPIHIEKHLNNLLESHSDQKVTAAVTHKILDLLSSDIRNALDWLNASAKIGLQMPYGYMELVREAIELFANTPLQITRKHSARIASLYRSFDQIK